MPGPKYVTDFEFPSDFGFSKSGSNRVDVSAHTRQPPQRFARGGVVRRAVSRPPLKPTPGQVVGGTLAAGAALAGLSSLRKRQKAQGSKTPAKKQERFSPTDAARGNIRRKREQELGLAHGGRPHYARGGAVGGNALVQRSKPTTEQDRVSGGKSPLRPGFKRGGKMRGGKMRGGKLC